MGYEQREGSKRTDIEKNEKREADVGIVND